MASTENGDMEDEKGDSSSELRNRYLLCVRSLLGHMSDGLNIQNENVDMMLDLCDMIRIATSKSLKLLKQSKNITDIHPVLTCIDHTITTKKYAHNHQKIMDCLSKIFQETLGGKY